MAISIFNVRRKSTGVDHRARKSDVSDCPHNNISKLSYTTTLEKKTIYSPNNNNNDPSYSHAHVPIIHVSILVVNVLISVFFYSYFYISR